MNDSDNYFLTAEYFWFNNLRELLERLPDPNNPRWTTKEKEKWIAAFRALIELLTETE